MYHSNDTLMSKGLSGPQQYVLENLSKEGGGSLFDVAFWYSVYNFVLDANKTNPAIVQNKRYASDITNISSVYRMMRSLENRGLVGRILNTDAFWIPIEWQADKPVIKKLPDDLPTPIQKHINKAGGFTFRVKGQTFGVQIKQESSGI